MSRLPTTTNCFKAVLKFLFTNVQILGRACEGKHFLKPVHGRALIKKFFNEPSKLYLTKENIFKINWVVFKLMLTYSIPIECHFNYYLANDNFQGGCPIFHGQQLRTIFLWRDLKSKILSTTLYKCAVLFQSWNYKKWIVNFLDFIDVSTLVNHLQTLHKVYTSIKSRKMK